MPSAARYWWEASNNATGKVGAVAKPKAKTAAKKTASPKKQAPRKRPPTKVQQLVNQAEKVALLEKRIEGLLKALGNVASSIILCSAFYVSLLPAEANAQVLIDQANKKHLIPKPKGPAGWTNGYNLSEKMGLSKETEAALRCVVRVITMKHLFPGKSIKKQDDQKRIAAELEIMATVPMLSEYYKACWPIKPLMTQILSHSAKMYRKARRYLQDSPEIPQGPEDGEWEDINKDGDGDDTSDSEEDTDDEGEQGGKAKGKMHKNNKGDEVEDDNKEMEQNPRKDKGKARAMEDNKPEREEQPPKSRKP
ncbi:hypothetical protein CPB83DRAFT_841152 [Crepidotus variabilis]|uniref:Uncharacterized protein n=1 Tax=Crepidotus variabilis TaxID=179855 RepID=A0A9P6JHW0_9AGAR|nr:hypothetical protein CPB83DRAFT_841152 [Crepidotus variabilis]